MKKLSTSNRHVCGFNLINPSRLSRVVFFVLMTMILVLGASLSASAQSNYTWTGATNNSWTNAGNWSGGTGFPGNNVLDTATLANTVSGTGVTLLSGTSVSIATLSFNQTSSGTSILDVSAGGTMTVANTLSLNASGGGTSILFVEDMASSAALNAVYAGNINVSTGGLIEMASYANPNGTKQIPTIIGNVDIQSGGKFDVDQNVGLGGYAGPTVVGSLTLESGGTFTMGTIPTGTTTVSGTSIRFAEQGNFLAKTGSSINVTGSVSASNAYQLNFSGTSTSATFQSGVLGSFFNSTNLSSASELITVGQSGNSFTLASDMSLPSVYLAPAGITSSTVNDTIGSLTGTNLLISGNLDFQAPQTVSGTYNGTLEISLSSNVTISGNINKVSKGNAGQTFIFNSAGYTFDESAHGVFSTIDISAASNWTLEGGGTFKGTYITLNGNTGTAGTSVVGATTLLAIGAAANSLSNLSTSGTGTIDPLSTFEYTGTGSTTAGENFVTSNRLIGRLLVGNGTTAATLGVGYTTAPSYGSGSFTNTLGVGGDITVAANATLDLYNYNVTEVATTGAANGGLNGSGTVLNSVASSTSTLSLDTTHGNGNFSGVIKDSAGSGGTVAVVKTGTGVQTFSGANLYSGGTMVQGGTLTISNSTGSATGTGAVQLNSGATLGGTGFISATTGGVTLNGNVYAGSGGTTDILHVSSSSSIDFTGASLTFNLDTATPGNTSKLALTATPSVLFSGTSLTLNLNGSTAIAAGTNYILLTSTATSDIYSGLTLSGSVITSGLSASFTGLNAGNYGAILQLVSNGSGGDNIEVDVTAVPEPSTWALMLGGLALLVVWQRRRRTKV
jgi:hypothetical protein